MERLSTIVVYVDVLRATQGIQLVLEDVVSSLEIVSTIEKGNFKSISYVFFRKLHRNNAALYLFFLVEIITIPPPPTTFPRPDITVNCLADGVNVELYIEDKNFHGIMYVKAHSHNPVCRRTVDPSDITDLVDFTVKFDTCGLFHYNVSLGKINRVQ